MKARQSADPAPTADVPTLLALARSPTPRDAEWALGQLARLALAGEKIDGLAVSGIAGAVRTIADYQKMDVTGLNPHALNGKLPPSRAKNNSLAKNNSQGEDINLTK